MGKEQVGLSQVPLPWVLAGALGIALAVGIPGAIALQRIKANRPTYESFTVAATQEALTLKITASGTVVPVRTVNLSPKTSGRLEQILVNQGDLVKAGQVIGVMDSRDTEAQMAQARALVAQAQARLREQSRGDEPRDQAQRAQDVEEAEARVLGQRAQVAQVQAQAEEARAQVAQAQQAIAEAQSQFDLAQQRFRRNKPLAEEGAISGDSLDEFATNLRNAKSRLDQAETGLVRNRATLQSREAAVAQAIATLKQLDASLSSSRIRLNQSQASRRPEQIDQARAQVAEAQGRLRVLEVQKQDSIIRAPFAGIITQRYADPGAFVTPTTSASSTASATSTSIVALATGLEVLANVPEVDIGQIRLNQMVEIFADSFPGQTFLGKVRLIAPEAVKDQNVTSFQVRVSLSQGLDELKSGMNVDLTFIGETTAETVVIPTVAILTREGKTGVLRLNERNEPEFRPITPGAAVDNQTQVLKGIEAGDRIFIDLPKDKKFEEYNQPS